MSRRNRMASYPTSNGSRDGPRPIMSQRLGPLPPHPAALGEELQIQREEIHKIIFNNRHLADDHLILQRELTAASDEIHRLSQVIPNLRAEKESQARELIQKGLKLESELRAAEPLKVEVMQLRAEAEGLNSLRQELSAEVKALMQDMARLQAENQQVPVMRADVDSLHQELRRAREAFEYEKKANLEQVEKKQEMEKKLISMACEIEKLRAELSTEKRVRGLGGDYGRMKGNPEMGYPFEAFGDGYRRACGDYDRHGPPRR